jgi:hypothetical protein
LIGGKRNVSSLIVLVVVVVIFIFAPILSFGPIQRSAAQSNQSGYSVSTVNLEVVTNVTTVPKYTLFSLTPISTVSTEISLNFGGVVNGSFEQGLSLNSPVEVEFRTSYKASQIIVFAAGGNNVTFLQAQQIPTQSNLFRGYFVIIPSGSISATISIQGFQTDEVFLGRYVLTIPQVIVQTPSNLSLIASSITTNLLLPKSSEISAAYGFGSASVAGQAEPVPSATNIDTGQGGELLYQIPPYIATMVIQSKLFNPLAVVLTLLAIVLVASAALGFFSKGRTWAQALYMRIVIAINTQYNKIMRLLHIKRNPVSLRLRQRLKARNFLILFILCGVLMVSFAALTGPNPSVGVYIIASSQDAKQIQGQLQALSPTRLQVVTPAQDYSDFDVMSSVGMFKVLVISGYPGPALSEVSKFILPNINNVPVVVIDSSSADPTFVSQIRAVYNGQIIDLNDTSTLSSALSEVQGSNALGLQISNSNFKLVLITEAGLSFLLILFGWAYLGAKVVEPIGEKSLMSIASVIVNGIFVFYLSEVLYIVTSATLNFPLSLHAVISGAQNVTAVGLLGRAIHLPFGGGTTPRLLMGTVGILLGGFSATQSKIFSRRAIALITGVLIILLTNPLELGKVVFQVLLLFVGNTPLGVAYSSALTLKGFLYGIGSALGGTITPVYLMSAGKMLYFAGLVPLALVRKMGRFTATFTFIICAVIVGDGGVRVGEMTPDKTVIAILPGLIAGGTIAFVLLLISWLERRLTAAYVRSGR